MSWLSDLTISKLRCFDEIFLELSPGINIFSGANASGKTSILEAVHILGMGRSFRSNQIRAAIAHDKMALRVAGTVSSEDGNRAHISVSVSVEGKTNATLSHQKVHAVSAIAERFPLQLITPNESEIITSGPADRRRFLDWGLFHVEHGFHHRWSDYRRYLIQRNAWLRSGERSDTDVWMHGLAQCGEALTQMRKRHLEELGKVLQEWLPDLLPDAVISLEYLCGWNHRISLADALRKGFDEDLKMGFTRFGPHRGDMQISASRGPAREILSKGQQKLLVCALAFSQERLLRQRAGKKSVFLVDEPHADLDRCSMSRVYHSLHQLGSQCLIATVDPHPSSVQCNQSTKMFHVQQGQIQDPPNT